MYTKNNIIVLLLNTCYGYTPVIYIEYDEITEMQLFIKNKNI